MVSLHSMQKNVHSINVSVEWAALQIGSSGLIFFSDRREEKQGQSGEASAAASQG